MDFWRRHHGKKEEAGKRFESLGGERETRGTTWSYLKCTFTKYKTWLERKMRSVHEDITNHWIDKEIAKLQKKIERANEKGWRLELNEYIDRRELLCTREERTRLLKEIPEVIPDTSYTETIVNGLLLHLDGVNKGENDAGAKCSTKEITEEDEGTILSIKRRSTNSENKTLVKETVHCWRKVRGPPRSLYAAIIPENIKLAYMKRSLLLELLKYPEKFEEKVVDCFVRIENDPKVLCYPWQKVYQLGCITGIKKTEQAYKIGETSTDIVLSISNYCKTFKISMLSDDDVEEEECEDLRRLVDNGHFKQPPITWFERKIRSVHEDITNHWIDMEIAKLQKKIEWAKKKGWHTKLNEFINRRELLCTPEERTRLLKEIPGVIPDTDITETNANGQLSIDGVNKGQNGAGVKCSTEETEGQNGGGVQCSTEETEETAPKSRLTKIEDKEEQHPNNEKTSEIDIIDLNHVDEDDINPENMANVSTENEPAKTDAALDINKAMWCYRDPLGNKHGPFALWLLRGWEKKGFFPNDFRVWKTSQCEGDAILLTVALSLAFPDPD